MAVTLLAILNAIPDSHEPDGIVAQLIDAVPPGSYLAISHPGADLLSREALAGMTDVADRMIRQAFIFRSRAQAARFFEGTDLVAPGLVRVEEWRPDPGSTPGRSSMWGAVGRKR